MSESPPEARPELPALAAAPPRPWTRRFWVEAFSLDLRSLALFRIGLALVLLVDLLIRSRALVAHYTDFGVLPRDVLIDRFVNSWHVSVHLAAGNAWQVGALFVLHAAAALMLLVGWRTRFATILCWFLLISLQTRNHMVLNAGDTLFRLLFFWAMFLPLGARWSVDHLRGRTRPAPAATFGSVATAALILQICMVYWFTVVLKHSEKWWNGDALFYILHADLFATRAGLWLREQAWALRPLTWASLGWEAIGPLLLFAPFGRGFFRTVAVLGFLGLHLGMWIFMEVGIFPLVCMTAWLVLLPAWFWDVPGSLRPFSFLRRAAGRCRRALDRFGPATPSHRPPLRAGAVGNTIAGLFFLYILAWNIRAFDYDAIEPWFPREANLPGRLFRLEQKWDMFAPGPTTNDGWYVIEGETLGGEFVDLLAGGGPVSWEKPPVVIETIDGRRWGKYLGRLRLNRWRAYRTYFTRYLGRAWNAEHEGDDRVDIVRFHYMRERTTADGPAEVEKVLLWRKTKLAG